MGNLSSKLQKKKKTDVTGSQTGKLQVERFPDVAATHGAHSHHQKYFSRASVKLSAVVSRRSPSAQSFVFMRTPHEDSWLIFPKLQNGASAIRTGRRCEKFAESRGDKWALTGCHHKFMKGPILHCGRRERGGGGR